MITKEKVRDKIIAVSLKNFPRLRKMKLKPQSTLMDGLGMDSLDLIELFLSLEEAFDVSIPEKELIDIKTLDDVVGLFYKKVKQKGDK